MRCWGELKSLERKVLVRTSHVCFFKDMWKRKSARPTNTCRKASYAPAHYVLSHFTYHHLFLDSLKKQSRLSVELTLITDKFPLQLRVRHILLSRPGIKNPKYLGFDSNSFTKLNQTFSPPF